MAQHRRGTPMHSYTICTGPARSRERALSQIRYWVRTGKDVTDDYLFAGNKASERAKMVTVTVGDVRDCQALGSIPNVGTFARLVFELRRL